MQSAGAASFGKGMLAAIAWCTAAATLHADDIEVIGTLETGLTYTDNVTLGNVAREDDLVLTVSPGLRLRRISRRVQAGLDFTSDYLRFLGEGGDEWRQNLTASVDAEAVEDLLFLRGRASVRQAFVTREGSLSLSKANRSENRRTIQNYLGGATLQGRFKSFANWRVDYEYGQSLSGLDAGGDPLGVSFSDSATHDLDASLSSGTRFGKFGWQLFAGGRRVERAGEVRDFEDDRAGGELRFAPDYWLTLTAGAGYTRNNLLGGDLGEDGFSWYGRLEVTPSERTELSVQGGTEGSRQTWDVNLESSPTRRTRLAIGYTDGISALALVENARLTAGGIRFDPLQDNLSETRAPLPIEAANDSFGLSDVDFRRQALRLSASWRGKRSNAQLGGNWERRTFSATDTQPSRRSRSYGGSFDWQRTLSPRSSLGFVSSLQRNIFERGNRRDTTLLVQLEFRKSFAQNFEGVISYGHSERFSSEESADLRENAVSIFLRAEF